MKHTPKLLASVAAIGLAGSAYADQVILDDLIVDGSACIGLDCANGENFGFDTIRMKENNTRLKFDDTSATASFPNTDWQLTANDSSNGGANKFSIDDTTNGRTPFTVEANTPTNALFVEDTGHVGFGTNNPAVNLHAVEGNTPTLRLEQDGSSGFSPQTWDMAGNETNFFIRDVNGGSALPFRIFPGNENDDGIVIRNGRVGMGTDNPGTSLHLKQASGALLDMMKLENNGDVAIILNNTDAGAATPEWKIASFNGNLFMGTPTSAGAEFLLSNAGDLTVTGNFFTSAGQLNVPDYVFEDDYELMPLSEVSAFIEENGHLPRIPSAGDVARDGLNMTQMQMALLEKVEELTLYTLEQEAQISALTEQLELLNQ